MGAFTSKDFVDMIEEDVPNTPVQNKRLIGFDPRSPTAGIVRTPIQVEKTPEKLDDPRSPTIGIVRTPIVNGDESTNSAETSTSSLNISSGISNCSLTDIQPMSIQAALDSLPPLDLDDDLLGEEDCPDSGLVVTETKVPSPEPLLERRVNAEQAKVVVNSRSKSAAFHIHSDNIEPTKEVPRSSPLRVMPDGVQRSPLGKRNVDVSSPRHIVQRKQANKLGMLKAKVNTPVQKTALGSPCRIDALSMEDKENMSM